MEKASEPQIKVVLPYGPAHREDGAAMYMLNAFNRIPGVQAVKVHYIPGESNESWPKADFYLDVDWAQDAFTEVANMPCRHPHVWWCSDAHVSQASFDWRLARARASDITLVFQKNHGQMFKQAGLAAPVFWFPTAAEHTCFTPILRDYDAPRLHLPPNPDVWIAEKRFVKKVPQYDWVFIGHINNDRRIEVLDMMSKAHPNWLYGKMFFEDCARAFGNAKIVFNVCHNQDINLRFFESLSCRVCQLTEWLPEYDELGFHHKEHCLFYHSFEEAVELMGEYLDPSKDQEREDMAERGWRKTWAEHTYANRCWEILVMLQAYNIVILPADIRATLDSLPPKASQPI